MSNIVELGKRGIRNEAELRRFIKSHAHAEPGQMVQAINISLRLSGFAAANAEDHRLNAGRMLLELRATIEAGGENWWLWQKGRFDRGRKDMEKLMRMASADDPEAALEEERADRRESMAKSRGAHLGSMTNAELIRSAKTNLVNADRENEKAKQATAGVVQKILELIELLPDQQRDQLKAACKERWSW